MNNDADLWIILTRSGKLVYMKSNQVFLFDASVTVMLLAQDFVYKAQQKYGYHQLTFVNSFNKQKFY